MECNTVERATWQKCTQEQNKKERESSVGICPWHKSNKSITNTDQYLHATYLQLIKSTESHLVMTYSRVTKQKKRKKKWKCQVSGTAKPLQGQQAIAPGIKTPCSKHCTNTSLSIRICSFFSSPHASQALQLHVLPMLSQSEARFKETRVTCPWNKMALSDEQAYRYIELGDVPSMDTGYFPNLLTRHERHLWESQSALECRGREWQVSL